MSATWVTGLRGATKSRDVSPQASRGLRAIPQVNLLELGSLKVLSGNSTNAGGAGATGGRSRDSTRRRISDLGLRLTSSHLDTDRGYLVVNDDRYVARDFARKGRTFSPALESLQYEPGGALAHAAQSARSTRKHFHGEIAEQRSARDKSDDDLGARYSRRMSQSPTARGSLELGTLRPTQELMYGDLASDVARRRSATPQKIPDDVVARLTRRSFRPVNVPNRDTPDIITMGLDSARFASPFEPGQCIRVNPELRHANSLPAGGLPEFFYAKAVKEDGRKHFRARDVNRSNMPSPTSSKEYGSGVHAAGNGGDSPMRLRAPSEGLIFAHLSPLAGEGRQRRRSCTPPRRDYDIIAPDSRPPASTTSMTVPSPMRAPQGKRRIVVPPSGNFLAWE